MPFISIIMLLMLGAIWGASFPFIKLSLESFDPATIVAFRLAGASVVLYLVMRWQRHRLPRGWRVWRDMLVVGNVGMVLPFLLITWGELHISSSLAAIIVATTPLFTLLLAFVWLRSESLG
ncbi:MAG: DMT family transporter, partial [Chloroflexaceae bacterium]|nr:DMT family transporter [Chloroflexaceae bacterium]